MNITIDTSAVLAVCLNEPTKNNLILLSEGANLIAPHSIHWEVGNALSAMLKRERIDLSQANACIRAYSEIPIKWVDVDLAGSVTIASRFRMYAYDAYLLNCAVFYHAPLLTVDGALKIAARQLGITVLGDSQ